MDSRLVQSVLLCLILCISGGYAGPPSRIIKGQHVTKGELPYHVQLRKSDAYLCGGSILDATHILTAAHCVVSDTEGVNKPEEIEVIVGSLFIDSRTIQNENAFAVSEITYHQDYNPATVRNVHHLADIAVLKLEKPISFNRYRAPINLPRKEPPSGASVVASGWGVTYHDGKNSRSPNWLQKLKMKIVSLDDCKAAYPGGASEGHICALGAPGSAVCFGDSGGPLAYNNEVIGVVSWGSGCIQRSPDVFTSVVYYSDWIKWAMKYH